jgi:tRNA-dihydrouridine synthase B
MTCGLDPKRKKTRNGGVCSTEMNPLTRTFDIGGVHIDPPLALAPMAEVTDTYYRSLIKELGGVGLVVSEFISAEGLTRKNDRSHKMLAFDEKERPVAIQIYGGDPDRMDDAAAIVEAEGVDIVDINMGCPVKKIVATGAGSGMLRDFDKAARVVEKIRKRVKIPVTVKVRKGWESNDVLPLLERFEEIGVAAIAIHGRTRNEAYTGASDWEYIAHVKQNLSIPVWGNGDVKTAADAIRMFETTGVDGVMIGRAALHNPFIFRDIVEYGRGGQALMPVPADESAGPPFDEIDRRVDAMQRYLSKIDGAPQIDKWKLHKARTVVGWFSRGIAHGKDIRLGLQDITTVGEVQRILDRFRESVAA